MKAKFIEYIRAKREDEVPFIVYEYRGERYTVCHYRHCEIPYGETLREQHERYQLDIDHMIEQRSKTGNRDAMAGDAMADFQFFMDYVDGKIDEDGNPIV